MMADVKTCCHLNSCRPVPFEFNASDPCGKCGGIVEAIDGFCPSKCQQARPKDSVEAAALQIKREEFHFAMQKKQREVIVGANDRDLIKPKPDVPKDAAVTATVNASDRVRRCSDTSYGATDRGGDSCSWYSSRTSSCGSYDDSGFTASSMCCSVRDLDFDIALARTPPPPTHCRACPPIAPETAPCPPPPLPRPS